MRSDARDGGISKKKQITSNKVIGAVMGPAKMELNTQRKSRWEDCSKTWRVVQSDEMKKYMGIFQWQKYVELKHPFLKQFDVSNWNDITEYVKEIFLSYHGKFVSQKKNWNEMTEQMISGNGRIRIRSETKTNICWRQDDMSIMCNNSKCRFVISVNNLILSHECVDLCLDRR